MSHYKNLKEMAQFIDSQIENKIEIDLSQIFVYCFRKWGFTEKIVKNYLTQLEKIGEISLEEETLKPKPK